MSQKPKQKFYIYFVYGKKAKAIKIGFTRDPLQRVFKLNATSPEPLALVKLMLGGKLEENQMHRQFASIRLHGEWFKATRELFQFIDSQKGWSGGDVIKCMQTHNKLPDEMEEMCGHEIDE